MKKLYLIAFAALAIIGCSEQDSSNSSEILQNESTEFQRIDPNTYAVIWRWVTENPDLVKNQLPKISDEFQDLWEKGIIENAYFDVEAQSDKLGQFANVSFFIKTKSTPEARSILNELSVVKREIATYTLFQVGTLWLDRKTDVINERGLTNSYAAVWETKVNQPDPSVLSLQNDMIIKLWQEGIIENSYFDIEDTENDNKITDFVFFVNAESVEKAEELCSSLPFSQKGIASYELYPVGVFWLGKFEDR